MARIIVEIELYGREGKEVLEGMGLNPEWEDVGRPGNICIDEAYLVRDTSDNSFYSFKFLGVRDD